VKKALPATVSQVQTHEMPDHPNYCFSKVIIYVIRYVIIEITNPFRYSFI
jgi:hypothetical protein